MFFAFFFSRKAVSSSKVYTKSMTCLSLKGSGTAFRNTRVPETFAPISQMCYEHTVVVKGSSCWSMTYVTATSVFCIRTCLETLSIHICFILLKYSKTNDDGKVIKLLDGRVTQLYFWLIFDNHMRFGV